MTDRPGGALVAAGAIASERKIGANFAQPESDLATVMSSSAERTAACACRHNIGRFCDIIDAGLYDQFTDTLYISTTTYSHARHTLAAASNHMLCETPLALNLADAHGTVDACAMSGVQLGTGHRRHNPATHRVTRSAMPEGRVGAFDSARIFHAVQLHEAHAIVCTCTGLEIHHGGDGLNLTRGVSTRQPVETVMLPSTAGEAPVRLLPNNHYRREARHPSRTGPGHGQSTAMGEDGVRSAAFVPAVRDAVKRASRISVEH